MIDLILKFDAKAQIIPETGLHWCAIIIFHNRIDNRVAVKRHFFIVNQHLDKIGYNILHIAWQDFSFLMYSYHMIDCCMYNSYGRKSFCRSKQLLILLQIFQTCMNSGEYNEQCVSMFCISC